MGWRVASRGDPSRWVEWRDEEGSLGRMATDDATAALMAELIDGETQVALTITGPFRDVPDETDEVGVFLLAVQEALPAPHEIIGTPPTEDTGAADIPEGAVA
jgi:hypothetical protein